MTGLNAQLSGGRGALSLDVAIEAEPGEVTALVGPSGAGKSTLLRAIAGLERLAGEVRLGAETWQDARRFVPAHRRPIGFVFQHGGLLPHLSVQANLEYGRRRARRPVEALKQAVALLRLEPLLERSPERLSGGERRRVALAQALATGPALLLLDEPLSGLDGAAKAELLPQLREVFSALSIPVIYVSHDPLEVAGLARCVVRLESGRVAAQASQPPMDDASLAGRSDEEVRRLAAAAIRAGLDP